MKKNIVDLLRSVFVYIVGIIFVYIVVSGFFIVNQNSQAIITQFGKLERVIKSPGLYFKNPFQAVRLYTNLALNCEIPTLELTLADNRRIIVDIFARYFISDPETFYKTVKDENGALQRLNIIISSELRNILGTYYLGELLSQKRIAIEEEIQNKITETVRTMGIGTKEIKIRKILFPYANMSQVFDRMKSKRDQQAQKLKGEAQQKHDTIVAEAKRLVQKQIADAKVKAANLVASAELQAIKIKGEAYKKAPKSLEKLLFLSEYAGDLPNAEIIVGEKVLGDLLK